MTIITKGYDFIVWKQEEFVLLVPGKKIIATAAKNGKVPRKIILSSSNVPGTSCEKASKDMKMRILYHSTLLCELCQHRATRTLDDITDQILLSVSELQFKGRELLPAQLVK